MKAVVLAGGVDRRMDVLTGDAPKTELYVAGKRLVDRVVESLAGLGLDEIIIVSTHATSISPEARGLRVRLLLQERPGVAGAAVRGLSEAGPGEVLLAYGDILAEEDMYRGLLNMHASSGGDVSLAAVPMGHALETYNRLVVDEDGVVVDAGRDVRGSSYVFGGAVVGEARALLEAYKNPGPQGVFKSLIGRRDVRAYVWRGLWQDVDTPWDLLAACMGFLSRLGGTVISGEARVSERAILEGPVLVEAGARIDHGAVVRGPAYIGRGTLVGVNAFVRRYLDAEAGAIIGSHSEAKRTVIQPRAYLGSYAYVADSVVGERASLSPYVVTLSTSAENLLPPRLVGLDARLAGKVKMGSVIGRDAWIGVRSILYPGSVVRPGSSIEPDTVVRARGGA